MVPFPIPPKEGLQLQTPRLSTDGVTRVVLAPVRAAAADASQPAWPPPITTTSIDACPEAFGMSETVASVLLNAAADRTRGAWPQSMRARAEKTSAMPRDMCTRREAAFKSVLTSRGENRAPAHGPRASAVTPEYFTSGCHVADTPTGPLVPIVAPTFWIDSAVEASRDLLS